MQLSAQPSFLLSHPPGVAPASEVGLDPGVCLVLTNRSVFSLEVYRAPANSGSSSHRHPARLLPGSGGPSPRGWSPCLMADALLFRERELHANPAAGLRPLQPPSLHSSPTPLWGACQSLAVTFLPSLPLCRVWLSGTDTDCRINCPTHLLCDLRQVP